MLDVGAVVLGLKQQNWVADDVRNARRVRKSKELKGAFAVYGLYRCGLQLERQDTARRGGWRMTSFC